MNRADTHGRAGAWQSRLTLRGCAHRQGSSCAHRQDNPLRRRWANCAAAWQATHPRDRPQLRIADGQRHQVGARISLFKHSADGLDAGVGELVDVTWWEPALERAAGCARHARAVVRRQLVSSVYESVIFTLGRVTKRSLIGGVPKRPLIVAKYRHTRLECVTRGGAGAAPRPL